MVQLREILNLKVNSCNRQISLDVKRTKLKEYDMDVEDILNLKIKK
jgi:hypothetical protein